MTVLEDGRTDRQLAFLAGRLPSPPARILEVGCGHGLLALALRARGYEVTAIDVDDATVAQANANGLDAVRADIADYHDEPFDAVLFFSSLHHVERLDEAVARVRSLLRPGGLLLVDEFAWEHADRPTAAWFYDLIDLLSATGVLAVETPHKPAVDPLTRWVHRHRDDDPIHQGSVMIQAIVGVFSLRECSRVPDLHRYLGGWLTNDAAGLRVFAQLRDIEQHRVADGTLAAVGLRLTAHRTD